MCSLSTAFWIQMLHLCVNQTRVWLEVRMYFSELVSSLGLEGHGLTSSNMDILGSLWSLSGFHTEQSLIREHRGSCLIKSWHKTLGLHIILWRGELMKGGTIDLRARRECRPLLVWWVMPALLWWCHEIWVLLFEDYWASRQQVAVVKSFFEDNFGSQNSMSFIIIVNHQQLVSLILE